MSCPSAAFIFLCPVPRGGAWVQTELCRNWKTGTCSYGGMCIARCHGRARRIRKRDTKRQKTESGSSRYALINASPCMHEAFLVAETYRHMWVIKKMKDTPVSPKVAVCMAFFWYYSGAFGDGSMLSYLVNLDPVAQKG